MRSLRDAYGDALLELGEEFPKVWVVDVDVGRSCKTGAFQEAWPERYVNVGIAEQNAAGLAAGLAAVGITPFVTTYAAFGSMRMCEQIRQSICYPRLNVKIMCSHGGLTPANDGATHQCVEDLGIMRTLPGMTVVAPGDYFAAKKLVRAAAVYEGPVYMRFTRDPIPFVYDSGETFTIGKGKVLREGDQAAIIAAGDVLSQAKAAAEALAAKGVRICLVDMHTIKPLDTALLEQIMSVCGNIVTVEDHNIINGLGSAVAEQAAEHGGCRVRRIGVQDRFGESGPYPALLEDNGITVDHIIESVEALLRR